MLGEAKLQLLLPKLTGHLDTFILSARPCVCRLRLSRELTFYLVFMESACIMACSLAKTAVSKSHRSRDPVNIADMWACN